MSGAHWILRLAIYVCSTDSPIPRYNHPANTRATGKQTR